MNDPAHQDRGSESSPPAATPTPTAGPGSGPPSAAGSGPGRWVDWAQLVRLPNVFTVVADVSAAFWVTAGLQQPLAQWPAGDWPWPRWCGVAIAGVLLYWGGMILNDWLDVEIDRKERSSRPLAAGRISLRGARIGTVVMFAGGVIAATVAGRWPDDAIPGTWMPPIIAAALIVMIVCYDGPFKRTLIAPAMMGGCRVLSFLLGASPLVTTDQGFPAWIVATAVGMGVYVMGVTLVGRREATGDRGINLLTGLVVLGCGGVVIALAPRLAGPQLWKFPPGPTFGLLIAMIVFPVAARVYRAVSSTQPRDIQLAVRSGVLTIIPLSAAITLIGAGGAAALAVFALVIPALFLAARFRVT